MNCAFHTHNAASVSCNGCGKPLCVGCDHRIKGFPYCQDCIVLGVDLLRQQSNSNYAPFVKKRTSPFVATLLSAFCPGLGAAYNGQTTKAIVYFAVFVGLFQMAVLTRATPLFVLGFMGMWAFAALDAWRTAQAIRAGVTPDVAEDILVRRFSGNPKLWGVVLAILGITFLFQRFFRLGDLMASILPVLLIGLGAYILRGFIFKPSEPEITFAAKPNVSTTNFALSKTEFPPPGYNVEEDYATRSRFGGWRER